jgi:hypothetical protein
MNEILPKCKCVEREKSSDENIYPLIHFFRALDAWDCESPAGLVATLSPEQDDLKLKTS